MQKQIIYLGYLIIDESDDESDRIKIYKDKKYISTIRSDWNHGVSAAKSKIDKVNGFKMNG